MWQSLRRLVTQEANFGSCIVCSKALWLLFKPWHESLARSFLHRSTRWRWSCAISQHSTGNYKPANNIKQQYIVSHCIVLYIYKNTEHTSTLVYDATLYQFPIDSCLGLCPPTVSPQCPTFLSGQHTSLGTLI